MATLPGLTINAPADAGEGGTFKFTVNKIINVAPACSVAWRVGGDVSAADFVTGQELSGRLTIPAGSSQGFIDLLVRQDADVEPNETMTVELFDPTGCILLKQPAHGTVSVTDLYQVTYTPNLGFVGTDTFDYLVKNSDGQLASATVEVNVTSTGPAAFSNGFERKIEAFVGPDSETMTGFELLFSIIDPALRTQGNGGVVRSNTGQDIRLEDGAGNALPYVRLRYNPGTGQVVGIVKRNRATGSTWNNIELYAGKQGMVVDEANPTAALSGLLACWRLDNGQDLSGNARHLTISQNMPTGQVLFEAPAGDFDRTKAQQAELANPSSWLNALSAFTLAMDLQVDQIASDSGVFRVGATATDPESLCSLAVRPESTSFYVPGTTNMFFAFVKIGATECRVEGSDKSLRTGVPTTLALAWTSGQAITQVVDDAVVTAYANPATPTGTLTVPDTVAGKPLAIAAGPRGYFDGKVGLVRLAATRRSNAWLKAEQRNRLYPRAMLAWAEAVGPNDAAACVAFPGTASASGPDLTLSPLASTPAAIGSGLFIVSASAEQGAVSLVAVTPPTLVTQLLYKQKSGFAGVDHVTYTVQDAAGRKSTSLITVTVSGTALRLTPDTAPDTTGVIPVSIPVQANDEGVGRHITNADVTPNPARRVVTIVGSGDTATLTYTPVKPSVGADTFTYEVTDGASTVARADVSVTVRRPPISARDASGSVTAGGAAKVISPSLGSDLGVDLIISARDAPSKGTADIITNATQIRYTPPSSVTGSFEDIRFKYTVRDAYSQTADAFITVRVNAAAPTVRANPDAYGATAGAPTLLSPPSPLANDVPNTGLIITGVNTFSKGGSATFTSTSITYTSLPATRDTETFNYVVSDQATPTPHTDTGVITMTVSPPVTTPDRRKEPNPPASNARIITVGWDLAGSKGRRDSLQAAYSLAAAGDHIQLANGSYTANFLFDKPIAVNNPVVIRSRPGNLNGAVITTPINVTGQGHYFFELKCIHNSSDPSDNPGRDGTGAINIMGSYCWVTRCWFTGRHGPQIAQTADHIWIGWNRITGTARQNATSNFSASAHIFLELPTAGEAWTTEAQGPHHIYIYRNYMYDRQVASGTRTTSSGGTEKIPNESHYVYFGPSMVGAGPGQNLGRIPECYLEENLIWSDGGAGNGRARGYYLKRGCIMRNNHCQTPDGADSNGFRHSRGGEIYGNTIEGDRLNINGGDNDEFTTCYSNAVKEIYVYTGSYNGSGPDGAFQGSNYKVGHQAGNYCVLAGNSKFGGGTLPIVVGAHVDNLDSTAFAGGKVHDVQVWAGGKTNAITRVPNWFGANVDGTPRVGMPAGITAVTPATYTQIQVGQELADQKP